MNEALAKPLSGYRVVVGRAMLGHGDPREAA